MTPQQGKGMQVLFRLANNALEQMPREEALGYIDALTNEQLADFMEASSAAGVATGTGGNLFYESAAARLRGPGAPGSEQASRTQKGARR